MLEEKHCTIAVAARRLNIIQSTARNIVSKYHKTGTFPIKKFVKRPLKTTPVTELPPKQLLKSEEPASTPITPFQNSADKENVKVEVKL